jgi:hypothetical protein
MTLPPAETATARRNLVQRIDRILREALATSTLSGWQADQIFVAIELLGGGHFADGEHAVMKAEEASLFEPSNYVAAARQDAGQLLERLGRVLAG